METGIDKVVRIAGNQTDLSKILGITPQAVQKWVQAGKPSPLGCRDIEKAFPGQVTRAELDPFLFGDITL